MQPIQTILYPTDFSECSRYAFQVAANLAEEQGARVVVLHVLPSPGPMVAYREALAGLQPEEYKEKLWKTLRSFYVPDSRAAFEHRLVEGEPVQEILKVAEETGCDLIIMGTHGRTGLERLILGSVAEGVLRKARSPVVTVKVPHRVTFGSRSATPSGSPKPASAAVPVNG